MSSFYLESHEKKDCFNCTACATVCPKKCITMKHDKNDGFIYPSINKKECINCGKCKKVCINLCSDELKSKIKNAYVLYNKNENVRLKSSSGGISHILMEYVIKKSGVVYGVAYDENLVAVHTRCTNINECEKFQGSKYVRSNIINVFPQVIEDLKNNKLVLFTGTPCQIAAIKSIVSKSLQKNLILCEIMCDSVASPLLFEKFKFAIEKKYNKKIKNINFRSKINGAHNKSMCVEFIDDTKIFFKLSEENLYSEYMQIFGCGLSAPISCQECKFEDIDKRVSDFTIGDYWGKKEILNDDNNGISFLLLNTEKAKIIFDDYIKEKIVYTEVNVIQALDNNHIANKKNILNKENFMSDFSKFTFEELTEKYVKKYRWRTKISKFLPKKLKENIKGIIKKHYFLI